MNCRVCGSDRIEGLRGYESSFLVRCRRCECVFADPLPTGKELEAHYAHKYENKSRRESWTSNVWETTGISLSRFATRVSKEQQLEIEPSDADERLWSFLESSPHKVLSQLSLGNSAIREGLA